jgi:hypothetical protein
MEEQYVVELTKQTVDEIADICELAAITLAKRQDVCALWTYYAGLLRNAQPLQPSDMPIVYLIDDDFFVLTDGNRVRLTRDQAKEVVAQLGEELEMDWYKDAQPVHPADV